MSRDKEKKHSFIRVSKNLWFMLKYSFKYAPSYTLVTLGEALGRGAYHIIWVLFSKYLFDAIEAGIEFKTVLFWTLLVAGYNAVFELFNKWRLEVYVPKVKLILHEGIQNELYKKARELAQSCYDDPEERIALIRACGYETSDCEASTVTVPEVFSAVYEDYNDLQKKQGFDLSLFKGETVIRYTYTVTNYPSDETVLIHMLVNDGVLIGADVMSTALDGFIKPLLH